MAASSNSQSGEGSRPFRSGDSVSRRALEDVIRQTQSQYSIDIPPNPADLEPLREVARRLARESFGLSPVVIELVRAMLRCQLGTLLTSEERLVAVADRVAESLFENPETNERLQKLWTRLTAEAS